MGISTSSVFVKPPDTSAVVRASHFFRIGRGRRPHPSSRTNFSSTRTSVRCCCSAERARGKGLGRIQLEYDQQGNETAAFLQLDNFTKLAGID
ncbi:MAG: hypothetical protein LBB60_03245 [Desulfovibrio sp.]|nr:hypothetical protein [Desulfovibrio sp.]